MKHVLRIAVAGAGLLALGATAQLGEVPGLASKDEPHGVVRVDVQRQAEQIFPVRVVEVNGNLVSADDKMALWLKPGKHTLTVRGGVDFHGTTFGLTTAGPTTDRALRSATRMDNTFGTQRTVGRSGGENKLEIEVEEGKIYYIGAERSPDTDNVWKPVVWKVEERRAE